MLQHTKSERHDEIEAAVAGPLTAGPAAAARVDPETGLAMPAWWTGDDDAYQSAAIAAAQASRR